MQGSAQHSLQDAALRAGLRPPHPLGFAEIVCCSVMTEWDKAEITD